jgi:hypothetical protein
MKTLTQIYGKWSVHGPDVGHGDKGGTHSYIPEYERLLAPYREKCTFLEIGLAYGLSVGMWNEYFGPKCELHAADISIVYDPERYPRVKHHEVDATKPELLDALGDTTFDVVIDDGSHMTQDQTATRDLLMPRMNPGGIYIIEDILDLEQSINLWKGADVIDLRKTKGRFDDVLIVYRT